MLTPDRHAGIVTADARAYGMVTARSTSQRRGKYETVVKDENGRCVTRNVRTLAMSDCVSYNPRNGETVDTGTVFTPIRTRNAGHKRRKPTTTSNAAKREATRNLLMSLPTVHNPNE